MPSWVAWFITSVFNIETTCLVSFSPNEIVLGEGKLPISHLLSEGLYKATYITPPYSFIPTGTYPVGKYILSILTFPISFCNENSLPLYVIIVPFKQSVKTVFGVDKGAKSVIKPSENVFTAALFIDKYFMW